jgi:hypothetical protein
VQESNFYRSIAEITADTVEQIREDVSSRGTVDIGNIYSIEREVGGSKSLFDICLFPYYPHATTTRNREARISFHNKFEAHTSLREKIDGIDRAIFLGHLCIRINFQLKHYN